MSPAVALQQALDAYHADHFSQAEATCRAILSQTPHDITARALLATLCCQAGHLGEGIAHCQAILTLSPNHLQALETLGDALSQQGRYTKAAQAFLQAVEVLPSDGALWAKAGLALQQANSRDAAVQAYLQALTIGDPYPETAINLGDVLTELGKPDHALSAYRLATVRFPGHAEGWYRLGKALDQQDLGRTEETLNAFSQAWTLSPQESLYGYHYALALYQQGDISTALGVLQPVLESAPQMVQALILGCTLLGKLGDPHAAYCLGQHALRQEPDQPAALVALGTVCGFLGRYDEAQTYYRQATHLDPKNIAALTNFAISRSITQPSQWESCLSMLDHADTLAPQTPHILLNKGLIALRHHDFSQGWPLYRWREQVFETTVSPHFSPLPRWHGPGLPDTPFVLCSEQGLGDQIMFAGLLARVVAQGKTPLVECDPRLCSLLQAAFPSLRFVATGEPPPREILASLTYRVFLGDLLALLRPDQQAAPWLPTPYLHANPHDVAHLRSRYRAQSTSMVIGVSWQSGNATSGIVRSLNPAILAPLVSIPGTRWVSLQYGPTDSRLPPTVLVDPEIDPVRNVAAFAAQVAAVDLVVSVDNSTVHMAGALGVPTLALLPYGADWRWFHDQETSLWYDSVHLLRQPCPGDWESVLCAAAYRIRNVNL